MCKIELAVLNEYSCVFPGLRRGEVSYRESYYNQPFVSVVADYFSVLLLSSWKVNIKTVIIIGESDSPNSESKQLMEGVQSHF